MIFYFTGTGNSLYAAKEMDKNIISIPQIIKGERLEFSGDSIGIVCPIYGHEMPGMHDSFPHALELYKMGYNSFALIYRPDDPYTDLARAISFIYDHAKELGVSREDYSLWGGSAGARMAATLGNGDALAYYSLSDSQ